MLKEVNFAVDYIIKSICNIDREKIGIFKAHLLAMMIKSYTDHWNVEYPEKGQAYRAIVISSRLVDPIISNAAQLSNILIPFIFTSLYCIWIDPGSVSVRQDNFGFVSEIYKGIYILNI